MPDTILPDNFVYESAVIDTGSGIATPIFLAGEETGDYDVPGQGGVNEWQQKFRGPWSATANVKLVNGQGSVPLRILNDNVADGNKTIIWKINGNAPFGFSQKTYTFSEDDANKQKNGIVPIKLSLKSKIKTATITIQDSKSVFNVINGNAANNSLNGGNGNDAIYAKAGNDYVNGQKGNDKLYGAAGNDTLFGNLGNDYINGGDGNDKLYGEAGNDTLAGSMGNDSLYGGAGDDILLASDGNDYLKGDNGNDILKGRAGNDILVGGFGNDRLSGNAGADKFVFNSASEGIDTIIDFKHLEDKIQVSASGFGIGQNEFNKFTYDSSTGTLFFKQTTLALLQPDLSFVPKLDITIV